MIRAGTKAGDWSDESDDGREGSKSGLPVRASLMTWSGLVLLVLVVGGLVLLAGDAPHGRPEQPARGRFRRLPSPAGAVAFAPDGQAVALGLSDGSLEIRDQWGGRPRQIEAGPGPVSGGVAYSPDGKTLASGGRGSSVKLWDVASGACLATLHGHSSAIGSLAFSPDGMTLASGSVDGEVKLWDLAGRRVISSMAGHSEEVHGLSFSPDGKTLASGSFDGTIKLWDLASGRERAGLRPQGRRVYSVAFAPDGKTLAFCLGACADGRKGQVVLWELAGGGAVRLLGHASFAALAFAPDGKTLACAGGDRVVQLWDVGSGRELASLEGHEGYISSLAFSPDGHLLATGGQDGLFGLFEFGPASPKSARHRL